LNQSVIQLEGKIAHLVEPVEFVVGYPLIAFLAQGHQISHARFTSFAVGLNVVHRKFDVLARLTAVHTSMTVSL